MRGAVRIALMFDSPKMHGTMMTSIESSLDDFADAECSFFCILLLGKTRLAATCRPFIGASAYVDMSMYDRIVDYSKPNR